MPRAREETCVPDFPARGRSIIQNLYEANRALAAGSENQQRLLTRLIAEQMAFELGPAWGCKAASPTRPQGPSELAYLEPPLWIWRWSDGDGHITGTMGAPLPTPLLMPLEQSAGQTFLSVDPIDHLQVSATRPPNRPSEPPPAPAVDLMPILDRLAALEQTVTALAAQMPVVAAEAHAGAHRPLPRYVATFWGIKLISVPEGA